MKQTPDALATLERLPRYGALDVATLPRELEHLLREHRARVDALTASPDSASWDSVVAPMEAMGDELQRLFSPLAHLHNVADDDALREAYTDCVQQVSAFAGEIAQHAGLFACYKQIRRSPAFAALSESQQTLIDHALRDFRLGGIDLAPEQQAEVRALRVELADLTTRFEQQLLDSSQAFRLNISDESRLAGLPPTTLHVLRQYAERDGNDGWTLTLDLPCYQPAMTYLDDRELRRTVYEAWSTRASDQGPDAGRHDNSAVMHAIAGARQRLARALGFAHYAELSLATKMAPSTDEVLRFLRELAARARPAAARELAELEAWAREHLGMNELAAWDIPYAAEKLRESRFSFRQEELRPYFAVGRVLDGLFAIAGKLFGVTFEPLADVDTWHEDVRFYAIAENDEPLGFFFLDLYARAGKRSGAWMDECLVRWRHDGGTQLPVAYLTCNFTPPVADQPTLLTHDEVITLFHEFGHGLHHMLTRVDERAVSGINGVPWDAVELPSQLMENWCWEREALDLVCAHFETGAPLPDTLFTRMRDAKNFHAALQTLRQLEFALFDFRLHAEYDDSEGGRTDIQALIDSVRDEVAVIRPPSWNRFQHSFAHIFAGGYAAGYYSYKWAEVLAADAYARFEEEGIFNRTVGQAFRGAVLERGGGADAMELFREFRGRDPEIDALLRQTGLAA